MPNSASASKRLRQDKVRNERNKSIKTAMKTKIKKIRSSIEAGDIAAAEAAFPNAAKSLDKAAANNVIHKNKAARKKSRLQKAILKAKNA